MQYGADVVTVGPEEPRRFWRCSPLELSLQAGHSEANQELVTVLLQRVLQPPPSDRHCWPPEWCEYEDVDAVQAARLEAAGAAANGCAALARAYLAGYDSGSEMVRMLFELPGLDIDRIEPLRGYSALALLARDGKVMSTIIIMIRIEPLGGYSARDRKAMRA